jgi:hypothetical protein
MHTSVHHFTVIRRQLSNMTKKIRLTLIVAALALVAMGLYPSNLGAQIWTPQYEFLGAGSSAQFNVTGFAALDPAANNLGGRTACTGGNANNHWTNSSVLNTSGMQIHDPRGGGVLDEAGSVWIGWDAGFIAVMDYDMSGGGASPPGGAAGGNFPANAAGEGVICVDVSLDSVVGMREYFANGQFVLNSTASAADTPNVVPGLPNGVALPAEVVYFFTNAAVGAPQVVNVALTDIRPEDGKFATVRALTTLGGQMPGPAYAGLGYGPGPKGTAIKSNFSSKIMQVADFAIDPRENDPFTTLPPRTYQVASVGAAPVLVLVNNSPTGAGHTGYSGYSQINHDVLAGIFSGQIHEVRDIGNTASSDPIQALTVFQREPLSGTYNTFDFNVTCNWQYFSSFGGPSYYRCQETDVNPSAASPGPNGGNPMDLTYTISNSTTATRQRVIGTSEMVKAVCGTLGSWTTGAPDSIGYAFWGFANFKSMNTNCRYLPVDNLDPLYAYPAANPGGVGFIPACTWNTGSIGCVTGSQPAPPFTKIVDGSYPIWSIYRWVYAYGPQVYWLAPLEYVQLAATTYLPDLVPIANMLVFRQHYDQCVSTAQCYAEYGSNGVDITSALGSTCGNLGTSPCIEPETGGDMGGKVLTYNSEIDYEADHVANHSTTNCITGAGGNWPNLNSPGSCEQTSVDLGNQHLPPW